MMIIIPPEFLWVKSIGRQSKHECTFWTINTADKIWRPRAKAWRGFWNCLVWLDQWWKSSFPVSKHPETGGVYPFSHTFFLYQHWSTIKNIKTKHFAFALARLDDLIASVTAIEETRLRAKKQLTWRGRGACLSLRRSWWEPNGDTEKGTGPSNAWIMSTGWLPTIRGFLAEWRPILELQQQQTAKK